MRVGIDIDGVIFPWTEAANRAVSVQFGIDVKGDHLHWDWLQERLTKEQWRWVWSEEGQKRTFDRPTFVYPGVQKSFGRILDSGHECHFVTHRNPTICGPATTRLLARQFEGHSWGGTHILRDTPKHELLKWHVFIDDKPSTVIDFLTATRTIVFSPVRPWNTELAKYKTKRLIRYEDPEEIVDWLKGRV
jgi:hypothetical protein